LNPKSKNP